MLPGKRISSNSPVLSRLLTNEMKQFSRYWCFGVFFGLKLELIVKCLQDLVIVSFAVAVVPSIYLLWFICVRAFMHASCLASFNLNFCISRLIHIPVFLSQNWNRSIYLLVWPEWSICQLSEAISNLSWKVIYLAIWLFHTASYLSAFLGFPLTTCILMFQAPSEAVLNKSMMQA